MQIFNRGRPILSVDLTHNTKIILITCIALGIVLRLPTLGISLGLGLIRRNPYRTISVLSCIVFGASTLQKIKPKKRLNNSENEVRIDCFSATCKNDMQRLKLLQEKSPSEDTIQFLFSLIIEAINKNQLTLIAENIEDTFAELNDFYTFESLIKNIIKEEIKTASHLITLLRQSKIFTNNAKVLLIYLAVHIENKKIITFLSQRCIKLEIRDSYGFTALHYMAQNGSLKGIERWEAENANFNIQESYFLFTPLLVAIKHDQSAVIIQTLARKTSPKDLKTALFFCVYFDHLEGLEILLNLGSFDLECTFYKGITILQAAIIHGKNKAMTKLLEKGACINGKSTSGKTALHYAALSSKFDLLMSLLSKGADPHIYDHEGKYYYDYIDKHLFSKQQIQLKREVLNKNPQACFQHIPKDLFFTIFSTLSITQLARCEQVAKSWKKGIADSSLWKKHFPTNDLQLCSKEIVINNLNIFSKNNFLKTPLVTRFHALKCLIHKGNLYYIKEYNGKIYINDGKEIDALFKTHSSCIYSWVAYDQYLVVAYENGDLIAYHLNNNSQKALDCNQRPLTELFHYHDYLIIFYNKTIDLYSNTLKKLQTFLIEEYPEDIKLAWGLLIYRTQKSIHVWNIKEAQRLVALEIANYQEQNHEKWSDYTIEGKTLLMMSSIGQYYSCDLNYFIDYQFISFTKEILEKITTASCPIVKKIMSFPIPDDAIFKMHRSHIYVVHNRKLSIFDLNGHLKIFFKRDKQSKQVHKIWAEGNVVILYSEGSEREIWDFNPIKFRMKTKKS